MSGTEFKGNISICPADTLSADVNTDPSWFDTKVAADRNAWHDQPLHWGNTHDRASDEAWTDLASWQSLTSVPEGVAGLVPEE
jgi:hypothetical protein